MKLGSSLRENEQASGIRLISKNFLALFKMCSIIRALPVGQSRSISNREGFPIVAKR